MSQVNLTAVDAIHPKKQRNKFVKGFEDQKIKEEEATGESELNDSHVI